MDEGLHCPDCYTCYDDVDGFCYSCLLCADCVSFCEECGFCEDCAAAEWLHCPECYTCYSEVYGYCSNCLLCDGCASYCEECDLCGECAAAVGLHCPDCYTCYSAVYGYCGYCDLCDGCASYCEDCALCVECGVALGHHCPDCGICYQNVSYFCPYCGLCDGCADYCENCDVCRECAADQVLHCPDCLVCYSEIENYCSYCFRCDSCTNYCEECELCEECALDEERHCTSCFVCYSLDPECPYSENCHEAKLCISCCTNEEYHCRECGDHMDGVKEHCAGRLHADHCVDCGASAMKFICLGCDRRICELCDDEVEALGFDGYCELCNLCYNCFTAINSHCSNCSNCYDGREDELCSICSSCTECTPICDDCGICLDCALEMETHCDKCKRCFASDAEACSDSATSYGVMLCVECCTEEDFHCLECGDHMANVKEACPMRPNSDHCLECAQKDMSLVCEGCGNWQCAICDDEYEGMGAFDVHCDNCSLCWTCYISLGTHCASCRICFDETPECEYGSSIAGEPMCEECCIAEGCHCEQCEEHITGLRSWCHGSADGGHCEDCSRDFSTQICAGCDGWVCGICDAPSADEGFDDFCDSCSRCSVCQEADEMHCVECHQCLEESELCEYGEEFFGDPVCRACCTDAGYHCSECDEHVEGQTDWCLSGGDHCADCCEANDWICAECGECCMGKGVELCADCGLCEECCTCSFTCPCCGESGTDVQICPICSLCANCCQGHETYISYSITSGNGQTVTTGNSAAFVSNAAFAKFDKVLVDGKEVAAANYTVSSGSTVVRLLASYINILREGSHSLHIVSTDGEAAASFTVAPAAGSDDNPFHDVSDKDWFYDDVRFVSENKLMNGTGSNTFNPKVTTTRGMIVTVLYRLAGEPRVSDPCPFDDVKSGSYYENAITWAEANGIVKGYGNARFGPQNEITREQMATILYRYADYMGYDVSGRNSLAAFSDTNKIHSYALNNVQWAVNAGLISGKGNGILDPLGSAKRCEVAAILHRFIKQFAA